MATRQDTLVKVKAAYRQWDKFKGSARGVDAWLALCADEIRFHSLAAGAAGMEFTESCGCKDDLRRYFDGLAADWEMLHFTPEEYVAQGDCVVMRGRCGFRHRRTGKVLETPKADFLRFSKGKMVEFYEFYDTASALAAAR